jgi:hypothetical protein
VPRLHSARSQVTKAMAVAMGVAEVTVVAVMVGDLIHARSGKTVAVLMGQQRNVVTIAANQAILP